ncbi:MAG: hypothetical protein P8181_05460 [bacterium]
MNKSWSRPFCAAAILVALAANVAPAQPADDFVQRALLDSTFNWKTIETDYVRIYYQAGSFAEKHRAMLLRSAEGTIGEVLDYLDESEYDGPLNVFYLNSRKEMKRIVGSPVSGFANWEANGIFVVFNPEWRSFEKHEFTHIVTMGMWGPPDDTSRWMVEGLPVACDGWCREYSVDEIAWHYLSHDELPPLQDLFTNFRSLGEIKGGFYAASVIGFIHDRFGVDALRSLWLDGTGSLTDVLGVDVKELEASWKRYLNSSVDKDVQVDVDTIGKLGCG